MKNSFRNAFGLVFTLIWIVLSLHLNNAKAINYDREYHFVPYGDSIAYEKDNGNTVLSIHDDRYIAIMEEFPFEVEYGNKKIYVHRPQVYQTGGESEEWGTHYHLFTVVPIDVSKLKPEMVISLLTGEGDRKDYQETGNAYAGGLRLYNLEKDAGRFICSIYDAKQKVVYCVSVDQIYYETRSYNRTEPYGNINSCIDVSFSLPEEKEFTYELYGTRYRIPYNRISLQTFDCEQQAPYPYLSSLGDEFMQSLISFMREEPFQSAEKLSSKNEIHYMVTLDMYDQADATRKENATVLGYWQQVGHGNKYTYNGTDYVVLVQANYHMLHFMDDGRIECPAGAGTYTQNGNILTIHIQNYPEARYEIAELTSNKMVLLTEHFALEKDTYEKIPIAYIYQ